MELNIIGSAGTKAIPRPFCGCDVCLEAKKKGKPYKRRSTSIFFREMHSLFELPYDLRYSLSEDMAVLVDNVFISSQNLESLDGLRYLWELISLRNRLNNKKGLRTKKIRLFVPISFKDNSMISRWLEDFKNPDVFEIIFLEPGIAFEIERFRLIPFKISQSGDLGFLIFKGQRAIMMALHTTRETNFLDEALDLTKNGCDVKRINLLVTRQPFIIPKGMIKAELLNSFEDKYYSTREIFSLIKRFKVKRTLFLLIEECFGLSYDDYKRLEEVYKEFGIIFGYDGLNLRL